MISRWRDYRRVDAVRLGSLCRAIRIKKKWRQSDLADRANVSRSAVSRLECGRIARLRVDCVLRVIDALGGSIDFVVRWQGGELDRLLNARHSGLHESVARRFGVFGEWQIVPEVSFSVRDERGVVDILAWHPRTRTLLVIELKTDIVDVNKLMATLDRKRRLAPAVARERGWYPEVVAVWLIVADSVMNRRRVRSHAAILRAALPADGRTIEGWLARPHGQLRCLSFWSYDRERNTKSDLATVRRVRRP